MSETVARAEAARRKVKRAAGLLKDAGRDLAALTEGTDALGVICAHDQPSMRTVSDLIRLGVGRYGAVDVVVIARPVRATHKPTMAADAAKESTHGTEDKRR